MNGFLKLLAHAMPLAIFLPALVGSNAHASAAMLPQDSALQNANIPLGKNSASNNSASNEVVSNTVVQHTVAPQQLASLATTQDTLRPVALAQPVADATVWEKLQLLTGRPLSKLVNLFVFARLTDNSVDGSDLHGNRRYGQVDTHRDRHSLSRTIQFQIQPYTVGELTPAFSASGGLVFYDRNFSSNSDFYNFVWRVGPSLNYQLSERTAVSVGVTWMYISKGQQSNGRSASSSGTAIGLTHHF